MSRSTAKVAAPSGTHLWLVLWKAYAALREFSLSNIESLGLDLTDFAILEVLLHKGPLPVNEIGKTISLTSGSMTVAIDRLTKRRLVERKSDDADRRTRVVHLTSAGRKLIDCAFNRHAKSMDELGDVLTARERELTVRMLKKLGRAARNPRHGSSETV